MLTPNERRVNELTTAEYTATITDEDGETPIPLADLSTVTLTLYDEASGSIINSRDDTNVKNTGPVTIHATSGLLTWTMAPADNPIVGSVAVGGVEKHIALFEWTWDSGNKAGKHEVLIEVVNLGKVSS